MATSTGIAPITVDATYEIHLTDPTVLIRIVTDLTRGETDS